MSKGFKPSAVRRVTAAFEEMIPDGYALEVRLSPDRQQMQVVVMDPEDPSIYVCNAQYGWVEKPLKDSNGMALQPPDGDVMRMAYEFSQIIEQYPAAKAREKAEQLFKTDFADRKQKARDDEAAAAEIAAQEKADEEAQAARDKLLRRTDREETEAMAEDAKSA